MTPDTASPPTRPAHLRSFTFHGLAPGIRLLVLGTVHGNETCGTQAITGLMAELDSGTIALQRGTFTFVPVTNPLAYQLKQCTGDRNLIRQIKKDLKLLHHNVTQLVASMKQN